jgi:hypothetical protein
MNITVEGKIKYQRESNLRNPFQTGVPKLGRIHKSLLWLVAVMVNQV